MLISFDTERILCDHVRYGTTDFNHHININGNDLEKYLSVNFKRDLFLFVIQL